MVYYTAGVDGVAGEHLDISLMCFFLNFSEMFRPCCIFQIR